MQRRAAGNTRSARRRTSLATAWTVSAALAAGLLAPAPASAAPKPTRKELTARQQKLADQAEKLSEQYNGLRVRMRQAQRAADVAKSNAERHRAAMLEQRAKVARLAADTYKSGSVDPVLAFTTSADPQAVLDQSATLNYFARQDGTRVALLLQTMQAAERARKSAEEGASQARRLADEAQKKRRELQSQLTKVERQLGAFPGASKAGPAPNVDPGGASAKAMGAVRAALGARGTPYSWGGGNGEQRFYGQHGHKFRHSRLRLTQPYAPARKVPIT